MTEEWKQIAGYEGLYEVSSLGRVRSVNRVVVTFSARAGRHAPLRRRGKVLKLNSGPHGYLLACLSRDGKASTKRVNILVCAAFHGARTGELQACHNDGNKLNNAATNLRWDTAKANQADRVIHGTNLCGSEVKTAKLTAAEVLAIRASQTFRALRGIDVSRTQYYRIKRGDAWAHLTKSEEAFA